MNGYTYKINTYWHNIYIDIISYPMLFPQTKRDPIRSWLHPAWGHLLQLFPFAGRMSWCPGDWGLAPPVASLHGFPCVCAAGGGWYMCGIAHQDWDVQPVGQGHLCQIGFWAATGWDFGDYQAIEPNFSPKNRFETCTSCIVWCSKSCWQWLAVDPGAQMQMPVSIYIRGLYSQVVGTTAWPATSFSLSYLQREKHPGHWTPRLPHITVDHACPWRAIKSNRPGGVNTNHCIRRDFESEIEECEYPKCIPFREFSWTGVPGFLNHYKSISTSKSVGPSRTLTVDPAPTVRVLEDASQTASWVLQEDVDTFGRENSSSNSHLSQL